MRCERICQFQSYPFKRLIYIVDPASPKENPDKRTDSHQQVREFIGGIGYLMSATATIVHQFQKFSGLLILKTQYEQKGIQSGCEWLLFRSQ